MTPRSLVMTAVIALALLSRGPAGSAQACLPEDNLAYPVQIVAQGGGGTGFFVRRDRELFLVTARHVLVNPQTNQLWSREATLRVASADVIIDLITGF